MTRLTISDFPPSDQHGLQEWVRSLSGALTAARPALPAVCFRFERRNEVRSSLWMFKSFIFTSAFTTQTSPCHYSNSSQRIKKKKKKKVWAENFTLAKDPNSKSPNGLRVQMADSDDCSTRKGGAELSRTMAVILSACELRALICLRNSPCRMRGWEGGCRSCF